MPPAYLITGHRFLGRVCASGINPLLRDVLVAVEEDLRAMHATAEDRFANDGGEVAFAAWCGLPADPGGWRKPKAGLHGSGSAVDIEYTHDPYIATRTGRPTEPSSADRPTARTGRRPRRHPSGRSLAAGGRGV